MVNDDRADWREAWALFPGDVACVWHGALHAGEVADSLVAAGFTVRSQIIRAKDRLVLSPGDYHWQHEPCWYAVKKTGKGHWAGDRKQTTLWHISPRQGAGRTCARAPEFRAARCRAGPIRYLIRQERTTAMSGSWDDFNDAQNNANLIPKRTLAKVRLTTRPCRA